MPHFYPLMGGLLHCKCASVYALSQTVFLHGQRARPQLAQQTSGGCHGGHGQEREREVRTLWPHALGPNLTTPYSYGFCSKACFLELQPWTLQTRIHLVHVLVVTRWRIGLTSSFTKTESASSQPMLHQWYDRNGTWSWAVWMTRSPVSRKCLRASLSWKLRINKVLGPDVDTSVALVSEAKHHLSITRREGIPFTYLSDYLVRVNYAVSAQHLKCPSGRYEYVWFAVSWSWPIKFVDHSEP